MRREIAAVDQLHAEVMVSLVLADLVDRHDVRMIQVRRGLRLQAEPLEIIGRREPAGPDHLQRQHAVQADLPCLVNDAHAAFGDDLHQLVVAEVADARAPTSRVVRAGHRSGPGNGTTDGVRSSGSEDRYDGPLGSNRRGHSGLATGR